MLVKNIIEINGKKYDFDEFTQERKKEIANALNERALAKVNHVKEKTA